MPEIQDAKAHLHPFAIPGARFDKVHGPLPYQTAVHTRSHASCTLSKRDGKGGQWGEGVPLHLGFLALEAGSGPDYLLTSALILGHTYMYRAVTRRCVARIPGCERWCRG